MKAVRIHSFNGPEVLSYEDVPRPDTGEGEVLVKVNSAGVNFADTMKRQGNYGSKELPSTLGLEAAGTIEKIGRRVLGFKPGQRVVVRTTGGGGQAEYVAVDTSYVYPCPDAIDPVEAGGMSVTFLTAYHLLKTKANIQAEETVLVQAGASGVGTVAIQLAKLWGARVIATASTEEKIDLTRSLGADVTINYLTHDFEQEIEGLTHGEGVQVVLECVGGEVREKSLRSLGPNGRMVTFGNASGKPSSLPLPEDLPDNRTITGFSLSGSPQGVLDHKSAMADLLALVEVGKLRLVVDRVLPMAEVAKAHQHLEGRGSRGKVILTP